MGKCTQNLYEIELQYKIIHRHRGIIWFHVLFTSLVLFYFHILVFHFKKKHEESQRFLHYLQQTNN